LVQVRDGREAQYTQITSDGTPAGTPNRRELATASDYPEASDLVTGLYDEFGFDIVNIGPLSESWHVERDRAAYEAPERGRSQRKPAPRPAHHLKRGHPRPIRDDGGKPPAVVRCS
jgi:hypothetical protein